MLRVWGHRVESLGEDVQQNDIETIAKHALIVKMLERC